MQLCVMALERNLSYGFVICIHEVNIFYVAHYFVQRYERYRLIAYVCCGDLALERGRDSIRADQVQDLLFLDLAFWQYDQ